MQPTQTSFEKCIRDITSLPPKRRAVGTTARCCVTMGCFTVRAVAYHVISPMFVNMRHPHVIVAMRKDSPANQRPGECQGRGSRVALWKIVSRIRCDERALWDRYWRQQERNWNPVDCPFRRSPGLSGAGPEMEADPVDPGRKTVVG